MTSTGGSRAWKFLRRNPDYIEAWREAAAPVPAEPAPIPLRAQAEADRGAATWGLLAWEDPLADDGPASPFWAEAPMLEAMPTDRTPAISDLLKGPEARLSGLRIDGGALILKAEQGDGAVQMRIADGDAFDPDGGVDLRLPVELDLNVRLRRTADLWPIAASATKSPAEGA